ncbi:MAG: head decoration protein [Salipiger marinus]|uniref:head decoration protein n=1 Tax=Salipiger marinus TaxID=555512 RepID=UPI00405951A9
MPILTEGRTAGDFVLYEVPEYSRDLATIAAGADLDAGTVLGRITASGKYVRSVRTATDGSETPVAVLRRAAAAADADVPNAILQARHTRCRRLGLIFDASWSTKAHRDTACAALAAAGITTT